MLAYLEDRPAPLRSSPRALILVVVGHAALLGTALTARGDLAAVATFTPTEIIFIDPAEPPPPPPPAPSPPRADPRSRIDTPPAVVPTPQPVPQPLDRLPAPPDPIAYAGTQVAPLPLYAVAPPRPAVIRAARFATPADAVRPPYPVAKLRLEEEASLRLALSIDADGRVVAVEPVGPADPAFLESARRHILKRWRYQPATEDGVAIASRIVVTLRFEIDS